MPSHLVLVRYCGIVEAYINIQGISCQVINMDITRFQGLYLVSIGQLHRLCGREESFNLLGYLSIFNSQAEIHCSRRLLHFLHVILRCVLHVKGAFTLS